MRVRVSLERQIAVVSGGNEIIHLPVLKKMPLFPVVFEAEETLSQAVKGCDSPLAVRKLKSSYPWAEGLGIE